MTDEIFVIRGENITVNLTNVSTFAKVSGGKMTTQQYKRAVGTFPNRQAAEEALHELSIS